MSPAENNGQPRTDTRVVAVLCVSRRPRFRRAVRRALEDLAAGGALTVSAGVSAGGHGDAAEADLEANFEAGLGANPESGPETGLEADTESDHWDPAAADDVRYPDVLARATAYLRSQAPDLAWHLHLDDELQGSGARAAAAGAERIRVLILDADGAGLPGPDECPPGADPVEHVLAAWEPGPRPEISPYGVVVYRDPGRWPLQPTARYGLRVTPPDPALLAADVVCTVTDHVEARMLRSGGGADAGTLPETTLSAALGGFLSERAGSDWSLWSYTGSVVSTLIGDLENRARAAGVPVLRGPSEHALAAGATARWLLDGTPFLIVVTSAMVDEFRGTLANLRQAGARGFIVCADSVADSWFPFQGTVHRDEDSRAVLKARGLPTVYLERAADLADGLREAYQAYDEGRGPVVLLATPSVLSTRDKPPGVPPAPAPPRVRVGPPDLVDAVADLVGGQRRTLLWQVGAGVADPAALDLLLATADEVGAALCDSLTRPGTVPGYRDGRPVPGYLGTLGLYGYSQAVFDYLHPDGKLRPKDEQSVFFLGSRLAEAATPFSARTVSRGLNIVQVTDQAEHLAPFAAFPIQAPVRDFLVRLRDRVRMDPEVLAFRRAEIARAQAAGRAAAADPVAALPVSPMTPNAFFLRLGHVLRRLIEDEGYEYTGVFDVGRGGASAIRNLPRTGPGFSGWYGRALMGDALAATPSIALTRPGNVLAFIGDGAAAMVADPLPVLLQQLCLEGHTLRGNLSVFRLLNGCHSIIRTYRETRYREATGGQTTVVNLLDDDWSRGYGPVTVTHRRIEQVDAEALAGQLTEPGVVNLYSVLVGHNSEGDGISLLSAASWRHPRGKA